MFKYSEYLPNSWQRARSGVRRRQPIFYHNRQVVYTVAVHRPRRAQPTILYQIRQVISSNFG